MDDEEREAKIFCGTCPDSHCGKLLYFLPELSEQVECSNCGQHHPTDSLLNVKEAESTGAAVSNLLKSLLFDYSATKKGTELVKVKGLSNYHCKLVSPLLTSYGMDKNSGKAKLLSELGQRDVFDCSVLGNRAFLIEKEHLEIDGYGRDKTGSLLYLKATLERIETANDCKESLVPLHADGDGHCLVHAISKAVVGRELLWHSLRQNLRDHLQEENTKYQALFRDFINNDEWNEIIAEADPDFYPETNEPFGLRNMHVFGLANVLHRPIILLDSTEGMQSCGDYSGVFLPALLSPDKCKSQGIINKPLVIAWSSLARNHYVPLVGIKGSPLPKIPNLLLPKAWGVPNELVEKYVEFDENGCCIIGGSRSLPESYIERLVSAMDEVFFEKHRVCPQLVADVKQFVYKSTHAVGISNSWAQVTEFTREAVEASMLYRCLSCRAVQEAEERVPQSWTKPGGKLYSMAKGTENGLVSDAIYTFSDIGVMCTYDSSEDILKPIIAQVCNLCKGAVRQVYADDTVKYSNGDRTLTKAGGTTKGCSCGFKHFWDGKEYDNLPKRISVPLEWNGKKVEEEVFWFEHESDPNLKSNAYEIASGLVQKHFPGEFGSELLVKKIVDRILQETALKQKEERAPPQRDDEHTNQQLSSASDRSDESTPMKYILLGPKKKTLHKEELTKSNAERLTKARIQHHAAYSQKRKNAGESPKKSTGSAKLGKQELPKTKETPKQTRDSKTNTPMALEPRVGNSGLNSPRDRKIRLSSSNGKQATVTLNPGATFGDLQEAVVAQLGIAKDRQKFRYGFPPQELKPPEVANEPLPLTHGDRVSVEELPEKMDHVDQESRSENLPPLESIETTQELNAVPLEGGAESDDEFEGINREQLATHLLNLIRGTLNVDRWETLQNEPEAFERGGSMYEKVVREIGPPRDDHHMSIIDLPGKTFAYNAKKDRLEICLGRKHVPVQPLDPAALTLAHARGGDTDPVVGHSSAVSHDEPQGLGAFSGVLRHRDAAQGRSAFSGKGRTLGESEKLGKEKQGEVTHVQEEKEDKEITDDGDTKMEVESVAEITTHNIEETTGATTVGNVNPSTVASGGGEAMVTETTGDNGGQITAQTIHADVEMESGKMAGNVSRVSREGTGAPHGVTGRAHDVTDVSHEETSGDHEMMSGAHEMSGFPHGMVDDAHEKGERNGEHAMTGVAHELANSAHEVTNVAHEVTNVARGVTSITHGISGDVHEAFENPREGSGTGNETRDAGHAFPMETADHLFDVSHESTDAERQVKNANSNVGADVRSDIDSKMEDKHYVGIEGDTRGDEMHSAKTKDEANEKDWGTKEINRDTSKATEYIGGSKGDHLQEDEQAPERELDTSRDKETGRTGDTDE